MFYVLCKKQNPLQKKMAVGSAGRQRGGNVDTGKRKATAVSDDVMTQKRLVKNSVSNVF